MLAMQVFKLKCPLSLCMCVHLFVFVSLMLSAADKEYQNQYYFHYDQHKGTRATFFFPYYRLRSLRYQTGLSIQVTQSKLTPP